MYLLKVSPFQYTSREKFSNTEVFPVLIQSEYGKIRTTKNSVLGHFSHSEWWLVAFSICSRFDIIKKCYQFFVNHHNQHFIKGLKIFKRADLGYVARCVHKISFVVILSRCFVETVSLKDLWS